MSDIGYTRTHGCMGLIAYLILMSSVSRHRIHKDTWIHYYMYPCVLVYPMSPDTTY